MPIAGVGAGRAAVAIPVLLLALAIALPDAADAKSCRRLCRKDVRACKKTCTGTRQERRGCKQLCKAGLLDICDGFVEPACIPPTGACGPVPLTCELLVYGVPGFQPGVDPLSSEFPPPPAGALLCGTLQVAADGVTAVFVFFSSDAGADALAAHFGAELAARGYALAETPIDGERAGCDRGYAITQGDTPVAGLVRLRPAARLCGRGGRRRRAAPAAARPAAMSANSS